MLNAVFSVLKSLQIYKAGKRPAVNQLCLSIPRGEVRISSLNMCIQLLLKTLSRITDRLTDADSLTDVLTDAC